MDRKQVMAWVSGYIDGWRNDDATSVRRLFTEDVRYRTGPYEESLVGHPPLEEFWLDDAGRTFTAEPEEWAYWPGKPYKAANS